MRNALAMPDELMTTTEALALLDVDRSTLTRWVAQEKIAPVLGGGKGQAFVFRASDVRRLAEERSAEKPADAPAAAWIDGAKASA